MSRSQSFGRWHLFLLALIITTGFGDLLFSENRTGVKPGHSDLLRVVVPTPVAEFGGHYYALTERVLDWPDAQMEAAARGGYLVAVNSAEEQEFLQQTFSGASNRLFWIGLRRNSEGDFEWVNNSPVTYTNWAEGEPNDLGGGEDFVTMNWTPATGDWNDLPIGFGELYAIRGIIEFEDPAPVFVNVIAAHSNKCLDVSGVSSEDGANIWQYACVGPQQLNQLWQLESVSVLTETWYRIRAQHSGKCAEVASGDPFTNVRQATCTEGDAQLFQLIPTEFQGQNWYLFVNRLNGGCLDVEGVSQADAANVITFPCHGDANQLWQLREAATPLPNLTFFRPSGWSSTVILKDRPDEPADDLANFSSRYFAPDSAVYLDLAVTRLGMMLNSAVVRLSLDGQVLDDLSVDFDAEGRAILRDVEIGPLSGGTHDFRVLIDPNNTVPETEEGDNSSRIAVLIGGPALETIPQFGAGLGLTSEVVVTNRSIGNRAKGQVVFFDGAGNRLDAEELLGTAPEFDLPAFGSTTFRISSPGGNIVTGSAQIISDFPVSAVVRFSLAGTGIAGVGAAEPTFLAIFPVRRRGNLDTAVAIRNTYPAELSLVMVLLDPDGNNMGSATRTVGRNARLSEFSRELFPDVEGDFTGSIAIQTNRIRETPNSILGETACCFAGVALELEPGTAFTTLPFSAPNSFRDNLFDVSNSAIFFRPLGTDRMAVETGQASLDPNFGEELALGDDTSVEIMFPAGFPLDGTVYDSFFVNSDGNVTFGLPDTSREDRDADRFLFGPPRIAPLLADLDVTIGGSIHADVREDRAVLTWFEVPQYGNPTAVNTFQLVLHSDGRVDFVYGDVEFDFGFTEGVSGVTPGVGAPSVLRVNWFTTRSQSGFRGYFEEFRPADKNP